VKDLQVKAAILTGRMFDTMAPPDPCYGGILKKTVTSGASWPVLDPFGRDWDLNCLPKPEI
jgi:hypothetical protein